MLWTTQEDGATRGEESKKSRSSGLRRAGVVWCWVITFPDRTTVCMINGWVRRGILVCMTTLKRSELKAENATTSAKLFQFFVRNELCVSIQNMLTLYVQCVLSPPRNPPPSPQAPSTLTYTDSCWIPKQGSLPALHQGSELFIVGPLQRVSGSTGWNDIYGAPWARVGRTEETQN